MVQLLIRHGVQLGPDQCDIPLPENANLLCDRRRRHFMVPRNHDRSDSRSLRICHSRRRLRARRVDHRHKSKKNVITLPGKRQLLALFQFPVSKRQHTKPIPGKSLILLYNLRTVFLRHPPNALLLPKIDRALQKDVRRPFGQQCRYTVQRIDRAHQLAVRIKRQFLLPLHCSPEEIIIHTAFPHHLKQC